MIGETINKFENLPEESQNLGKFNKMFRLELDGEKSAKIKIGKLTRADRREVYIDDKMVLVNFVNLNKEVERKSWGNKKFIYGIYKNGKLIETLRTSREVRKVYKIGGQAFIDSLNEGIPFKEVYQVRREYDF